MFVTALAIELADDTKGNIVSRQTAGILLRNCFVGRVRLDLFNCGVDLLVSLSPVHKTYASNSAEEAAWEHFLCLYSSTVTDRNMATIFVLKMSILSLFL